MRLTRRDFAAGIAAGVAAPYVLRSASAQGATIKIGMCVPVTGPAAEPRSARAGVTAWFPLARPPPRAP